MCSMRMIEYVICVLIVSRVAWPAHPFGTDDAGTVLKGSTEIEVGGRGWQGWFSAGYPVAHGISDRMDLCISSGYCALPENERGVDPLTFGLKLGIIPDRFAITASTGFGESGYTMVFVYSQPFGAFVWNGNLGYETENGLPAVNFLYAASIIYSVGTIDCGIEAAGKNNTIDRWQTGIGITIGSLFRIDGGIGGEFTRKFNLFAASGVTFLLPAIERKVRGDEK